METQQITRPQEDLSITPSQPKTQMFKPIVLTFFISAIVFGFGGYYFGVKFSNTHNIVQIAQSSPVPTFSPSPSPKPTSTPMKNWEIYTTPEYSFEHPKGLKVDTEAAGVGVESIRFQFMGPKQVSSGRTQASLSDGYAFIVTKIGSVNQKTLEQLVAERRNATKDSCGPDVVLSEIKNLSLGKGVGVQYSVKNCMGDYTNSYISNGKNVYEITQLYVGETADQKKYEETTNQILHTLIFL